MYHKGADMFKVIQSHHHRWRTVVMPTEHGSWGFILEPILLGLLLTPGFASLMLSTAFFLAFLLRQPFKLYWKDKRAGRHVPRTDSAMYFIILFSTLMFITGAFSLSTMASPIFLLPLVLALPLIVIQFNYDLQGKSRMLGAELCGVIATGSFAASLVLIQGWPLRMAFSIWVAFALKGITAVLYVRARLRLERNIPVNRWYAWGTHLIGIVIIGVMSGIHILPLTAFLAMGILTLRAGIGLSSLRKARPPKMIGIQEMTYGFSFVLLLAIGYWFKLFI